MTHSQEEEKSENTNEGRLLLRLANREDESEVRAIDELRKTAYRSADHAAMQYPLEYIEMCNDAPEDQVIVAFDSSGRLVASGRFGLATTQEQLVYQLGAEFDTEQPLPVVTAGRACAIKGGGYYKALRLVILEAAEMMIVNEGPVAAQMGVNAINNGVAQSVIKYGYEVFQVTRGAFIFTGPHVCNRILNRDFQKGIALLQEAQKRGSVPRYNWEGPWPFAAYLPDYITGKKSR